jgi:hypothetical protein
MTSHVGRIYALALSIFVFFVVWACVAARPWAARKPSAQVQLLTLRRQALTRETALVNQILSLRAKASSSAAPAAAAAPAVRVVTLPPLTITRTS